MRLPRPASRQVVGTFYAILEGAVQDEQDNGDWTPEHSRVYRALLKTLDRFNHSVPTAKDPK